jgi:ubiquinone/menaquinone biosynthesis C-methylase UbiE
MPTPDELPDYGPALKAYHAAFEPELAAAMRRYELGPSASVLDCPCGDGFYTKLLARHVGSGSLTAVDHSPTYLAAARRAVGAPPGGTEIRFVEADAYTLPFEDGSFDLAWCAQSMISLKDPLGAIRELARVLKPAGRLAVLETDEYHHILLPWPVGLELTIQNAVRAACRKRYGSGSKFAQSRKLRVEFRAAGLTPTVKATIVADRVAPFGPAERQFLLRHFEHLRALIKPELSGRELKDFDRFTSAEGAGSFLNDPDGELTCLAVVCHATK